MFKSFPTDAPINTKELPFETNGLTRNIFNTFFVPVLNILPRRTITWLVKTHKSANAVVENKTNHYALEVLYQRGNTFRSKNILQALARRIWFHTNNARAVRNRLLIVKDELIRDIRSRIDSGDKYIKVLNIASGSARAILEAIHSFNAEKGVTFDVTFLDKNPKAVAYSQELAKEFDFAQHKLQWVTASVGEYFAEHDASDSEPFDVVEMVGLLDYFDDERTVSVFERICDRLNKDAFFITANIVDNVERPFVENVVGWKMVYRTATELKDLIVRSGFAEDKVRMQYEPMVMHTLACSYK